MTVSDFPYEKRNHIYEVVKNLKQTLRDNNIASDPFVIAKFLKIDVSFIPMKRPYAITIPSPIGDSISIYIADNVDSYSRKILCYHELGHILCEGQYNTYLFDHTINHESEYTANLFMAQFLPVLSRHVITSKTKIEDINRYISGQIRSNNEKQNTMVGQISLFDFIDLDDFMKIT